MRLAEEILISVKEQEAIRKLMVFLHEWDSAHKVAQSCILDSFIKSKAEPERSWSSPWSLFLAHLTAWLRMAYVFPQTAGGAVCHRYLTEFLEIGSVSIPLEISGLNHLKEEDKKESVKLLPLTTDAGVQDLAKFLASSNKAEGQEDTQVLLDSSGCDNPKYQNQVYPVAVRLCTSPQAQHGLCRCSGSCRIRWERCPVPSRSPCWACCALCTWSRKAGSVYPPWALWGRPWLAWASVAGVKGELRSSRPHIPKSPSRRTAPPH
ncbi:armadillo-like helical domain containing protein 1 [Chiroxiphia lanceolata]|uniref:armadillo-like helical domain containing protein 1 n=1 Tax=Chiroxiphia lanceolata TaxID=296741 RepID=UPI0013CEABA4|nr:armadillo-like helical domain containing protein 1 [Chiroxiphia lanceolata]